MFSFFLAYQKRRSKKGILNLTSLKEISDFEREIFGKFIHTLKNQIEWLKPSLAFSPLRKSLFQFEETLLKFKKSKN